MWAGELTRATTACNHGVMTERNLKIVRFIGATPSTAYCDVCKLAFRTRTENLQDSDRAKAQMQADFDQHECRPEEKAVDEALFNIL